MSLSSLSLLQTSQELLQRIGNTTRESYFMNSTATKVQASLFVKLFSSSALLWPGNEFLVLPADFLLLSRPVKPLTG